MMVDLVRKPASSTASGELTNDFQVIYGSKQFNSAIYTPLKLTDNGTKAVRITTSTVDGADDNRLQISSSGAAGPSRGAYVEMKGNEFSSDPGKILWESGTAASGTALAWQVNVGASSINGHSIDGNGNSVFGPTSGITQNHVFYGQTVSFTANNAATTIFHNYTNTALRAQVGVNGTTGKIISVGSTNAYTIACASGIEFGDLSNNLYGSMLNGVWTFGDGTLAATSAEVRIRKTNAINNRLIEGIDAATRGYVRINAAQTNLEFEGASDRRIKEQIAPIEDALDKITALNPVTFKLKTGSITTQGFIAQEFSQVFPQAVSQTDDGTGDDLPEGVEPWSMSDACLPPYLVKAIIELKALVNNLQQENTALAARVEALENALEI